MKNLVTKRINAVKSKLSYASAMVSLGMAGMLTTAGATGGASGGNAQQLMTTTIDVICKLIIVPAGIMVVTGLVQYASAHSDGDGPAQKKAINMIAAGIMLAVLSFVMMKLEDTFAGLIST